MSSKIGEGVLAEVKGSSPAQGRLDESMPGWKAEGKEKSALTKAFRTFWSEFSLGDLVGEKSRTTIHNWKRIPELVKDAEKEAKNPGWRASLNLLYEAARSERDAGVRDGPAARLEKAVKEIALDVAKRLASRDAEYRVYSELSDKLAEMSRAGFRRASGMSERSVEVEYPWLGVYDEGSTPVEKVLKAAESSWNEVMSDAPNRLKKALKP